MERRPLSGTVGRPHVAPGAFVEATTGTVLAEIAQLDPILVSFGVAYLERQRALDKAGKSSLDELFQGSTLSLELPSGRIYEHSGKPEYSGAEIDQSTMLARATQLIKNSIDLARHDKIVLVQAFDLFGSQRDGRVTPAEADIRVMAFGLAKSPTFRTKPSAS
jgi:multidrug efflux pump subunit AcrA (membrane-fusion protein)